MSKLRKNVITNYFLFHFKLSLSDITGSYFLEWNDEL